MADIECVLKMGIVVMAFVVRQGGCRSIAGAGPKHIYVTLQCINWVYKRLILIHYIEKGNYFRQVSCFLLLP